MLNQIHIRNFAIINQLELDFNNGMSVLTGETGAGKSILVDALGLVLGDRADSEVVRHGEKRAEITVQFDISGLTHVRSWLEEQELDEDNECVMRRVISAEGPSKAYINGRPAPLQLMKSLGEMLVDIHGQHQHQSLSKADIQRQLLDDFGNHAALAREVEQLQRQWKDTSTRLQSLRQSAQQQDARIDLLRYHLRELESLALAEDEFSTLEEEHRRLANGGEIQERCSTALNMLENNDDNNALHSINQQLAQLEQLRDLDPKLANVCNLLNDASIQVQEACSELSHYLDRLELDPQRLNWVEKRLEAIHDLARKHHIEPEALPQLQLNLAADLGTLENVDIELATLEKQLSELSTQYQSYANKLSQKRKKAAAKLAKEVTSIISQLGMPAGQFSIELLARESQSPHRHGMEQISFEVAANPGQPAKPLAKVASGGELSRISLAIQVLLSNSQQIPTLIFDEVDTGIGGAVAETVGRLLRTLGTTHQVLCVTHLPQVAALGHQHIQVLKSIDGKTTQTQLRKLSDKERQEEIARMLGGVEITQQTRAHAAEMIDRAAALA